MNLSAVAELVDPETLPPAADPGGHSDQSFVVEIVAHRDGSQRRAIARGQDIYAVSAPLVVEAVERLLSNPAAPAGVFSAGQIFPARDFLAAFSPEHLIVVYGQERTVL